MIICRGTTHKQTNVIQYSGISSHSKELVQRKEYGFAKKNAEMCMRIGMMIMIYFLSLRLG
jgi:hypothetical protein